MIEPKPCPVCGGTEIGIVYEYTGQGCTACLICEECAEDTDTRGPVSKPCATEDEAEADAIRAWNGFATKN
jgi:hypothetical protein